MIKDIKRFIKKFKFNEKPMTRDKLTFRMNLLREEFDETFAAYRNEDPEEFVDGHIDLIVVAIGNLELAGVDTQKAWDEVHRANMSKVLGVKPGRENSHGIDVKKPKDWKKPSHKQNHGELKRIFKS